MIFKIIVKLCLKMVKNIKNLFVKKICLKNISLLKNCKIVSKIVKIK